MVLDSWSIYYFSLNFYYFIMKLKIFLLIFLVCSLCCFSRDRGRGKYNLLLNPTDEILKQDVILSDEETLFILDYSNSMNEILITQTKYEMLLESMKIILTKFSPQNKIGVRLYGQRWGFTPMDACRATTLIAPIGVNNFNSIESRLLNYRPRGMTPITYSLKQAVKKDFSSNPEIKKHIILITDGGENCDESPCTYAMELIKHRKDIKIDVIAFNIDNDDDLDQLECVAKVTSGKLYNADTKAELVKGINNAFKAKKRVDAKIMY